MLFALIILISSMLLLKDSSNNLKDEDRNFNKYKQIATQYNSLQSSWGKLSDADRIIKSIVKKTKVQNLIKEITFLICPNVALPL